MFGVSEQKNAAMDALALFSEAVNGLLGDDKNAEKNRPKFLKRGEVCCMELFERRSDGYASQRHFSLGCCCVAVCPPERLV